MQDKITSALSAINSVMAEGHPVIVAYSGGKDSSVCLNLVLTAAICRMAKLSNCAPIIVTHADTGIENPEMARYARRELDKIMEFGQANQLSLKVKVAEPCLNSRWAVRVIGGRGLPVFPSSAGGQRDCTIDFKVRPMQRLRKSILSEQEADGKLPVTVIGTRFKESDIRCQRMKSREESADAPWSINNGQLFLSPIANWTVEDVWTYLSECMDGHIQSFSDFKDTFRIYAEASGTPCAIEADLALGGTKNSGGGCGARFGCMLCTATNDKSMQNMLASGEYEYLREVHQLQQFIINTQYDFDRRLWVGRSINKNGYIAIGPDVYSPSMILELLRYCLTIDAVEKERAAELSIPPRFELVSACELIAIDAMWSLQGYHRPFSALREYREIYIRGRRYPVEDVTRFARVPLPAPRYFHVGADWDEQTKRFSGFRDPITECIGGSGCMGGQILKDGRIVLGVKSDSLFKVDEEAALFILSRELDYLLDRLESDCLGYTYGYLHHAIAGYLTPAKGKLGVIDNIMRRTAFKERHGLAGQDYNLPNLLAKSVSKFEMEKGLRRSPLRLAKHDRSDQKMGQLALPGFDMDEEKVA